MDVCFYLDLTASRALLTALGNQRTPGRHATQLTPDRALLRLCHACAGRLGRRVARGGAVWSVVRCDHCGVTNRCPVCSEHATLCSCKDH